PTPQKPPDNTPFPIGSTGTTTIDPTPASAATLPPTACPTSPNNTSRGVLKRRRRDIGTPRCIREQGRPRVPPLAVTTTAHVRRSAAAIRGLLTSRLNSLDAQRNGSNHSDGGWPYLRTGRTLGGLVLPGRAREK